MFQSLLQKLQDSAELQKILRNIGWLFFDKVLRYGVGFFVGVWVARYLGSDQFGVFNAAVAFTVLFGAIATLGLKSIIVREVVKQPDQEQSILGSAFLMMIASGVLTFGLSILIAFFLYQNDPLTFRLIAIISLGFVFQAFQSIAYYYEAKVTSKFIVYATNSAYLVSSGLKVYFILTNKGLEAFALASLVDVALSGLILFFIYQSQGLRVRDWRWNKDMSRTLLRDSYPLILSGIMVAIYMRIDQVMLPKLYSEKEAGLYAAAVKLTELWYFIPTIIQSSSMPNIIQAKDINADLYWSKLKKLFSIMILFSLAVGIPTTLLGEEVVSIIFGEEYLGTGSILIVMIWALLFVSIGVARSTYLVTENLIKIYSYTIVMGVVINIILNVTLIPKFGGLGAVFATLGAQIVAAYLSCFFFKETRAIGRLITNSFFTLPATAIKILRNAR
ncbi:MAG: flippase [Bacteroidota bacterium]